MSRDLAPRDPAAIDPPPSDLAADSPGEELLHGDAVGLPGRPVVATMFAFGLLVVAGFWTYWAIYDRPLAPLRALIEAELPDLAVQIAAGTEKKSDVRELRVILRTPYDPHTDPASESAFEITARTVARWDGTADYDRLVVIQLDGISVSHDDYWRRSVAIDSLLD